MFELLERKPFYSSTAPIIPASFFNSANTNSGIFSLLKTYSLISGKSKDITLSSLKTYSAVAGIGGSWGLGALGAKGGAAAGAAIGTAIMPGVGTAIGGAVGGLVLGIAGSYGGNALGRWVVDITAME